MSNYENNIAMICYVAKTLGKALCQDSVFVGGCTTGLLLTDDYTREQVRHTEDVDLIVHVISTKDWYCLLEQLRTKGFQEDMLADVPVCALRLQGLRVDFMPDNEAILGFSNRWYADAYATATDLSLPGDISIRMIRPEYFVATKLEAYLGRGNNDPLASRDIEDILLLIDGRSELDKELLAAPLGLRQYIAIELAKLRRHYSFDYAIDAAVNGDTARADYLAQRLNLFIDYGKLSE